MGNSCCKASDDNPCEHSKKGIKKHPKKESMKPSDFQNLLDSNLR